MRANADAPRAQEGTSSGSNGREHADHKSKGAFERAVAEWINPAKLHPDRKHFVITNEIAQGFDRKEFHRTGQLVTVPWLTLRTIAKATGFSKDAVDRHLEKLEAAGSLAIDAGHQRVSTRYRALTYVSPPRGKRDISQPAADDTYVSVSESYVSFLDDLCLDRPGETRQTSVRSTSDKKRTSDEAGVRNEDVSDSCAGANSPAGKGPADAPDLGLPVRIASLVHDLMAQSLVTGPPNISEPDMTAGRVRDEPELDLGHHGRMRDLDNGVKAIEPAESDIAGPGERMVDVAGNDVGDGVHLPTTVPPGPTPATTKRRKANGHDVGRASTGANIAFDRFWAIYPNKDDPGLAAMKFHAARKLVDVEIIIAGAQRFAVERAGEDPQFTQKAHTWLMARAWENAPKPKRGSGGQRADPAIQRFGSHEAHLKAALGLTQKDQKP